MINTLVTLLIILWIIGLAAKIGGAFIHLLLLVALFIVVYRLLTGRR